MEFKRYNSIENSYRIKTVDYARQYFPKEEFIVQEKIHGSNFAFYVNKDGVRCAKRSGFLEAPESFFNADILLAKYEFALKALFVNIDCESISIHGEIYGGSYPHKDVAKNICVSAVQKGVFYSPNREFIAFDMKVDGEYITIDSMNHILDEFGIPRSDILLRGTLDECLDYPNEFNSTLPAKFGLPELDENICEGVVIKPNKPLYFTNDSRVVFKNKNAKWSETEKVTHKQYEKEVAEHVKPFLDVALSYVTENRLRNVLSKTGPITDPKKAFGMIMKPFNQDVIEEFTKENEKFLQLEKNERKIVTSKLNKKVGELIRGNLFNIIDGEF
jgi:Rnl2 family RNA ligase